MPPRSALVRPLLRQSIEDAISKSPASLFANLLTAGGGASDQWLVIKYIPTKYCRDFRPDLIAGARSKPRLRISESPGFTWGDGNYVTPLAFPVSTAIYGRAGIVAELDKATTQRWRIFDARDPKNQDLYLQWAISQPAFKWLSLTCHALLANQYLRNSFRDAFRVDCIVFHPDQRNATYTKANDVWMCVSDWTSTHRLARGESDVLRNPQLVIIVSEEFAPIGMDVRRRSLIGPRGPLPTDTALATDIRQSFNGNRIMELTT